MLSSVAVSVYAFLGTVTVPMLVYLTARIHKVQSKTDAVADQLIPTSHTPTSPEEAFMQQMNVADKLNALLAQFTTDNGNSLLDVLNKAAAFAKQNADEARNAVRVANLQRGKTVAKLDTILAAKAESDQVDIVNTKLDTIMEGHTDE